MADEPEPQTDAQADALAAELLKMGSFGDATGQPASPTPAAASKPAAAADAGGMPELGELEALLKQATTTQSSAAIDRPAPAGPVIPLPSALPFDLPAFERAISDAQAASIDLLRDVELNVKIELGRSKMLVEDVLKLAEGSVVELDKLAGDPVDVFVNDKLVARGEVLVLNDNFCVRINEIVAGIKEEGM